MLNPAWSSHVTLMTFSEFGRTSWDNDGQGTDHGSSAPHFVIGPNVQGRAVRAAAVAGRARPLGADGLHTSTSARTTRRSSTAGWAAASTEVLGGTFENLGLFARGTGHEPGRHRRRPARRS